jgi:predicted GIY-YIG superfamily endonuclease
MKYYVYVIRSTNYYFKVGVARNPERRLSELQTGNPEPLNIEALILCPSEKSAYGLESLLHKKFSRRKVRSEWFFFGRKEREIHKGRQTVYNTIIDVVSHPNYEMSFRITKWPDHKLKKEHFAEDTLEEEEFWVVPEEDRLITNHMREIMYA